jgi:hypothetical protein
MPRSRRVRPANERRDLAEIWLMVASRFGITLLMVLAVIFQRMRDQMHFVVLAMLAAFVFLAVQSNQSRTRRLRDQTFVDLAVFLAVIPTMVLTGFVAAQTGELLPAERSALIETSVAALTSLVVLAGLCYRLFSDDRATLATSMLPGWLIAISLTFVLHEYRNQTVIGMIAVSYFIATIAVALGILIEEPVRRYIAAMFYVSTVIVGLLVFNPGLDNLAERETIIGLLLWGLVAVGMIVLIVVPNPRFDLRQLLESSVSRPRTAQGRRDRRPDDFSESSES